MFLSNKAFYQCVVGDHLGKSRNSKHPDSVIGETKVRGESKELWQQKIAVLEAMDENLNVGLLELPETPATLQEFEQFLLH